MPAEGGAGDGGARLFRRRLPGIRLLILGRFCALRACEGEDRVRVLDGPGMECLVSLLSIE